MSSCKLFFEIFGLQRLQPASSIAHHGPKVVFRRSFSVYCLYTEYNSTTMLPYLKPNESISDSRQVLLATQSPRVCHAATPSATINHPSAASAFILAGFEFKYAFLYSSWVSLSTPLTTPHYPRVFRSRKQHKLLQSARTFDLAPGEGWKD